VVVSLSTLDDSSISSGGDLAKAVSQTLSTDLGDAVAAAGIDATVESAESDSPNDDSTDDNSSDDDGGISGAAIGGIVAGAVILIGAIAYAAHMYFTNKNQAGAKVIPGEQEGAVAVPAPEKDAGAGVVVEQSEQSLESGDDK
jgi:hypothetical protein